MLKCRVRSPTCRDSDSVHLSGARECALIKFSGGTQAGGSETTLENQHYPVVELALCVFIVLSLEVQETNVLNLLSRIPGIGMLVDLSPGLSCYPGTIGIYNSNENHSI